MPSKRKNIVLGTAYGIKEFPVTEKKHENGLEVEEPLKKSRANCPSTL